MSSTNVIGCREFAAGYQIVPIDMGLVGWRNGSYLPFMSASICQEGFW